MTLIGGWAEAQNLLEEIPDLKIFITIYIYSFRNIRSVIFFRSLTKKLYSIFNKIFKT